MHWRFTKNGEINDVKRLTARHNPYSIGAYLWFKELGLQSLPSRWEELELHLKDLCDELKSGPKSMGDREKKECAYAIAFLWKDPPAGTAEEVEKFLKSQGVAEFIRRFLDCL